MTEEKIDIVVLWVDGSDPEFIRKKQAVTGQVSPVNHDIDGDQRYRDYGTFHFWFRMIEKHAPWVNHIYLVTNGQKPDWLNLKHPKLRWITHKEFMPKEYLPSFNSSAIELNIHRIEGLSEHFIYFNDDMFMIKDTQPSDFYKNGQPKLLAVYDALVPWSSFTKIYRNDVELIYRHFPHKEAMKSSPWKFFNYRYGFLTLKNLLLFPWGPTGYVNQHLPVPVKKSTLAHLWDIEGEILDRTSRNQIRDYGVDVNQYICQHWQIESNQFYPMSKNFGEYIDINQVSQLDRIFNNKKRKLLCVNDDENFNEKNLLCFIEKLEKITLKNHLLRNEK